MSRFFKFIGLILLIASFNNTSFSKENFFNEALELFKKEKYEDARFLFERNIVFNPKDANSYLYLAKIYNQEENQRKEEYNLETTLLIEPDNEEALLMLIKIALEKSNYEKVKDLSDKFVKVCKNLCDENKDIQESLKNIENHKEKLVNLYPDAFVYTLADMNSSLFAALKVERNVMFIILSLIIIVAAFNIISGLTILVKNKTRDIAILKSIGVLNKSIIKIFFLVGVSIGTSATIFGIFLGVVFSIYVEKIRQFLSSTFNITLFPEEIYFLSKMPSEININSIVIITICSIFITIVVSIFPALKAANMDPIKSLKYE